MIVRMSSQNIFTSSIPVLIAELKENVPTGYTHMTRLSETVVINSKDSPDDAALCNSAILLGSETTGFQGVVPGDLPPNFHYICINSQGPLNVATALAVIIGALGK